MTQRFAFCPWRYWGEATADEKRQQDEFHARLAATGQFRISPKAYLSPLAGLHGRLAIGARSYVAGFAYLSHDVTMGDDCTVNPYTVVRGRVTMGNGVRIASHASVIGVNHAHDDLTRPMHEQGELSIGIEIGDDVWIGANAVVVDGVRIGSHAIVGAGAVVTRDVPDWQVVVGNPARIVRDRRAKSGDDTAVEPSPADAHAGAAVQPAGAPSPGARRSGLPAALAAFGARAAEQWPAILRRCRHAADGAPVFVDRPGVAPVGLRPLADAIEIAAMFGALPPDTDRERLVATLQRAQDPASGMPYDPARPPPPEYVWDSLAETHTAYMILAAGYALEALGAKFTAPLAALDRMPPQRLAALFNALPWRDRAWTAGSWVDALGTGLWINRARFGLEGPVRALFAQLAERCQPHTGMWGQARREDGWLQPVNGFYRLTRGTYAQFGERVPYPESAVDTLLAHARVADEFAHANADMCNVLDVVHPLGFLAGATAHRRPEAMGVVERLLVRLLPRWIDGEGFGFAPGQAPGLMGTEMGLAIVATAADALGEAQALGFAPRGVHRLAGSRPA